MGRFPDAVVATGPIVPPVVQSVVLVRGIGIASQENTMLSGSSGGFTDGLELVEARIGSYLYLTSPAPTLEISIESPVIDVSGGRARNCAVPCYFVACGLVPGTDPPGTYKPCTSASVRARSPAGNEVALEFLNPSGNVLDRIVTPSPAAGELALTHRVLLYAAPTVPHPPGLYRVRAILMNSAGAIDRTAELSLELK
jgi:hypothetical protein